MGGDVVCRAELRQVVAAIVVPLSVVSPRPGPWGYTGALVVQPGYAIRIKERPQGDHVRAIEVRYVLLD